MNQPHFQPATQSQSGCVHRVFSRRITTFLLALAIVIVVNTTPAWAGILTNGNLTVNILETNGAIGSVVFDGYEFFHISSTASVADYGMQLGSDDTTFAKNTEIPSPGTPTIPVTVTGGNVVTGTYTDVGAGANVTFVRTYSIVPARHVIRIVTDITNHGDPLTLAYFDTYNAEQGVQQSPTLGHSTYNLGLPLGGATAGQSSISSNGGVSYQETVIAGSLDPRVTVAAGGFFSLFEGADVNDFFDFPFNDNGALDDNGLHIGIRTPLGANVTTRYTFDLSFGETPAAAQNEFLLANAPEPATVVSLGVGFVYLLFAALRTSRRRAK